MNNNTMNFDYLTLTFLSTREIELSQALDNVLNLLKLGDKWSEFLFVGRNRFYPYIYRYNDISINLCADDRLKKQGICVTMTGNGLAYYQQLLERKGETLRRVLRGWRAASVGGDFTRVTRVDVAADDIHYNNDAPFLTMRKIRTCVNSREFRSLLMAQRPVGKQTIDVSEDFSKKADESKGHTIYFGNRRSSLCCRFYDKLLEQKSKNEPVADNLTSWVRCEFEFHDARAMAVINAFCDMSDEDFSVYMAEVFNNYVCFIKKDDINRSRCSVKMWWAKFLGTVERSRLVIPPFKPSVFSATSDWLRTSVFPTLYSFVRCVGLRKFLQMIKEYGEDRQTPRHKQMQNDFVQQFIHQNINSRGEETTENSCNALGLDYWIFTSRKSKQQAMRDLQEDHKRFCTVNGLDWKLYTDKPDRGLQGRIINDNYAYVDDDWYEDFCNVNA